VQKQSVVHQSLQRPCDGDALAFARLARLLKRRGTDPHRRHLWRKVQRGNSSKLQPHQQHLSPPHNSFYRGCRPVFVAISFAATDPLSKS